MPGDPLRSLRIIGYSFIPVIVGTLIAVFALRSGWDTVDDDLATLGLWVAGILGVIGLVAAVRWRARVTERPVTLSVATMSFFITVAVAETSLLAGFVVTVLAHDTVPYLVGAVLFSIALAVVLVSFGQIDVVDGDPSSPGVIR